MTLNVCLVAKDGSSDHSLRAYGYTTLTRVSGATTWFLYLADLACFYRPETFGPAKLNIPKAPALGLLLEQPHFDSYNRKVIDSNNQIKKRLAKSNSNNSKEGSTNETPSKEVDEANQLRETLDYAVIEDKVEQFKREIILKTMYDQEDKEDTFALWLSLHDGQTGPEFDYLNSKGVIREFSCYLSC